jgi:wyosine [tRNA(Phe)-imidazoG37] synthetase (radical SAM superfamily)
MIARSNGSSKRIRSEGAFSVEMTKSDRRRRNKSVFLYGPVPSRRLGYSLGIDIVPLKTCSMDCVYCQLGSNPVKTMRKKDYVPAKTVLSQIRAVIESGRRIDAITFSGSGEPTLHSGIDIMIRGIKAMTDLPVVVLTNSSSLATEGGRKKLLGADIVVPSLDAATEAVFKNINRPAAGLTAGKIIRGLVKFRRVYHGQIWLEIMLVKGVNDSSAHVEKLEKAVARIRPDKIQLNTVVRPPAEKSARPLGRRELEKIRSLFGAAAEIIADFRKKERDTAAVDIEDAVMAMVGRRPVTNRDISFSLGMSGSAVRRTLRRLLEKGAVKASAHRGSMYYERR